MAMLALTARRRWFDVAVVGAFGSFCVSPLVRKLLQPAAQTTGSAATAAIFRYRFIIAVPLRLAVQADREHDRARLRLTEVVDPLGEHFRAAQVGFGIDTRVVGPRVEVPARKTQIDARESERVLDPALVC